MKKVLDMCGTVMRLDITKHDVFAEIYVDLAGIEMRRIFEAFVESLPPSLKDKNADACKKVMSLINARSNNFEIDIKPVMNMKVLRETNDLILNK